MEVKLIDLTKEFDKPGKVKKGQTREKTIAVDHITCDIPSGKLIGLLGPSGCGKSTTLYMIAGLHTPTHGTIYFGDSDVTNLPPEKRGIGLVFQNYALYPHLTVEENIMFPLMAQRAPKAESKEKALEMAKLVGIEEYLERKPGELSGGQQQRVAIARALVKLPEVLLLDEPLSNLDARLRLQTREEIKKIQRKTGITTIFVTHDQEEALSISDEIIVMNYGTIQQIGAPQEVYNEPKNEFVAKFLGTPPINIIPAKYEENKLMFSGFEFVEDLGDLSAYTKDIHIGIRPEFIELDPNGAYEMLVDSVEYIGRDKTIIFQLGSDEKTYKAIVPQCHDVHPKDVVRFSFNRYFIFDDCGNRIK